LGGGPTCCRTRRRRATSTAARARGFPRGPSYELNLRPRGPQNLGSSFSTGSCYKTNSPRALLLVPSFGPNPKTRGRLVPNSTAHKQEQRTAHTNSSGKQHTRLSFVWHRQFCSSSNWPLRNCSLARGGDTMPFMVKGPLSKVGGTPRERGDHRPLKYPLEDQQKQRPVFHSASRERTGRSLASTIGPRRRGGGAWEAMPAGW